jgi:hypothetical protein
MGRGRDTWKFKKLDEERAKRGRLHPAWRGVGCFLVVLLGIGGYFLSGKIISSGMIYIPLAARRPSFAPWLPENVFVQVVAALIIVMLSFTLMSTIYAIAFPIKPGEYDVPPIKRDRSRRRR